MFLKPIEKVVEVLKKHSLELANGCQKVFLSISGGVDSTVVAAILCQAFNSKNVVALFRDIKSDPKHIKDVRKLQKILKFKLIFIDANYFYDGFLKQCQKQFKSVGLEWHNENYKQLKADEWANAYASLKSRFTTPFAGFISKAIDRGQGRIFGTGNLEEDGILRYFDKFGDGAVDNNILNGLTKMEVRQIAIYFSKVYDANIFYKIALKTPSADLLSCGDKHNDEDELSGWAKKMGFNINISYGTISKEGNIAWAVKQDLDHGVIKGDKADWQRKRLEQELSYNKDQIQLIYFLRIIEKNNRHKDFGIPGLSRKVLRDNGLVD